MQQLYMYSALFTNNNALMRYLAVPSFVVFVHLNLCRSIGDTPIFTGKEILILNVPDINECEEKDKLL